MAEFDHEHIFGRRAEEFPHIVGEVGPSSQRVGVPMQPGHIILRHPFNGFVTFGAVASDHVGCFFGSRGM